MVTMTFKLNCFSSPQVVERKCPPRVETDETFPLHTFDQIEFFQVLMAWTLRFEDVLDVEKLNSSLQRLLDMDGWRKLGGRLRKNETTKKLEIHVPKTFTPERPAARFSCTKHDMSIRDHPLASKLPRAQEKSTILQGPVIFRPLLPEDIPTTLDDLIYNDVPQISLHTTSFSDETLVTLIGPHTLFDGMGTHACVLAWSKVLAGKESEVPPMMAAKSDAAAAIGTRLDKLAQEPWLMASKQLKGLKMLRFLVRSRWDRFRRPKCEDRTICITPDFMQKLQLHVAEELSNDVAEKSDMPFVSQGDVLVSLMTRLVATAQPRPRPITVMNALEIRSRLKSVFKESEAYVQNLVFGATTLLSGTEATHAPLGKIAARMRESIAIQATEAQLRAYIRELRQVMDKTGKPIIVADPDSLLLVFTNWQKARFFEAIDFSPAVVKEGDNQDGKRVTPPGKINYHHFQALKDFNLIRNCFIILGKDHEGNYWLNGMLDTKTWAKVEQDFAKMTM